jgi:hypothetical protein
MFMRSNIFVLIFRLANLLAASFFVLCVLVPDSWRDGPFNPSPPPPPGPPGQPTFREIILTAVTLVWFVSALGLFFRSRLAWFGCWFGIGMATYISGCLLLDVTTQAFSPHAAGAEITVASRALVVQILAPVMMIGTASVPALICLGLILGLITLSPESPPDGRLSSPR